MTRILSATFVFVLLTIWAVRDGSAQSFEVVEGSIPPHTLAEMGLDGIWVISDDEASLVRGSPYPPPPGRWLVGIYNRFLRYSMMTRAPQIFSVRTPSVVVRP